MSTNPTHLEQQNQTEQQNKAPVSSIRTHSGFTLWLDGLRCKLTVHAWRRRTKKARRRMRGRRRATLIDFPQRLHPDPPTATIPVNLQCAAADGVSEQIRNFVVPLCANIHMAGSMITITACATAVCLMNQLPISLATVVPFIMTLGVAMVASPGAPGGSIMTALPFLYMIFGAEAGDPNGPICAIMVALYITQDSFGTACNVSGDNAIGVIVETIYQKFINKSSASV